MQIFTEKINHKLTDLKKYAIHRSIMKKINFISSNQGEGMGRRYIRTVFVITLCIGILLVSASVGFSKPSKKHYHHRKYSRVKTERISGDLVLRSAAVIVEDQETGKLLVQKQAKAVLPIASITKLMTAMVVLDAGLDLDEAITIEQEDVDTLYHSSSRMPVGTTITRRDALLLALMSSDNRCAHALGRTYFGGFEDCIDAMNEKAKSMGLLETHYNDTTGLSGKNVSSARDLARLVDTAYQYKIIREFTTTKKATVYSGERVVEFHNTNHLVHNPGWQIGLSKTGFTGAAGRCLVMQANLAQRSVLIVLLDSQGKMSRIGDANRIKRWLESKSLLQRT
jgi:serine-type D-Ala-D-Ala endopeptidase (penicillin-binding protein 7)